MPRWFRWILARPFSAVGGRLPGRQRNPLHAHQGFFRVGLCFCASGAGTARRQRFLCPRSTDSESCLQLSAPDGPGGHPLRLAVAGRRPARSGAIHRTVHLVRHHRRMHHSLLAWLLESRRRPGIEGERPDQPERRGFEVVMPPGTSVAESRQPVGGSPAASRRPNPDIALERMACVIGLLCAVRFVEDNLDHQQADLLIAALLIAGVLAWQRGRDMLVATWFGLGAAIKGPPVALGRISAVARPLESRCLDDRAGRGRQPAAGPGASAPRRRTVAGAMVSPHDSAAGQPRPRRLGQRHHQQPVDFRAVQSLERRCGRTCPGCHPAI